MERETKMTTKKRIYKWEFVNIPDIPEVKIEKKNSQEIIKNKETKR
jgi:hypothetical protein